MEYQAAPPGGNKTSGPEQEILYGLTLSIATILVSLRLYVRACMVKKLWWDDFYILLGLLLAIAGFGLSVAKVNSGLGRHAHYLSPEQISYAHELNIIFSMILLFSTMFTKTSICIFLLRLFVTNGKWKITLYTIITLIVATNVSSASVVLLQCRPAAKLWNTNMKGTCWRQKTQVALSYFQGVISILFDFVLAFLPTYFLKDLRISFRRKLSICALMSLGVFTGGCAVIKTVLFAKLDVTDYTYNVRDVNHWGTLEQNVAIIAAAIPTLRPLWATKTSLNRHASHHARQLDDTQRLSPTRVLRNQQIDNDSTFSRFETHITAQNGTVQREDNHRLHGCAGIIKTSDVSMTTFRESEGEWFPKNPGSSQTARSVEDTV